MGYYDDFQIKTASEGVVSFAEALYKNNMHSESETLFSISCSASTSVSRYYSTSNSANQTVEIPLYLYDSNGVITDVLNVIIVGASAGGGASTTYSNPGGSGSVNYTMITDTGNTLCSASSSSTYNLFGMDGLTGATSISLNGIGACSAHVGDYHDQYDYSAWGNATLTYTLQYIGIDTE